ncbi:MAG: peptidoglycan endopeptidase [Sphingomonadaceae bacterium]|nr:peptidoglycan endopeptidase [Sphingomonadaceae bacterium]
MTGGQGIADAACALIGTPFRLHGRDPVNGVDCVGLVACALESAGTAVATPTGYRLHNRTIGHWLAFAVRAGLVPCSGPVSPGDILLVEPGPWQHHLLVAARDDSFIHAHAGLGRVVAMPGPLPWAVRHRWRRRLKG